MSNLALPAALAATLDDKYTATAGRVFLTGTQALVRLPMMQRQRDLAAGLNTAGFISGYRGCPLGGLDQACGRPSSTSTTTTSSSSPASTKTWRRPPSGAPSRSTSFPAPNTTACSACGTARGRASTAAATSSATPTPPAPAKHGGVLVLAGDDHAAKSSTLPHQTEHVFKAVMMPVLYPAGVQEYLDLGLHGWAMSRYSGCWVAFKAVADTVESSASVRVDLAAVDIVLPTDFALPPDGLNIRWPDPPLLRKPGCSTTSSTPRWPIAAPTSSTGSSSIAQPAPRHHHRRQVLSRRAPGARRSRHRRRAGRRDRHPPLQGRHGLAARTRRRAPLRRGAGRNPGGRGKAPADRIPVQGRALQLARGCAPARDRQVRRKRRMGGRQLAAAGDRRTVAGDIARVIADRIGRFFTSPSIEARLELLEAKERAANRRSCWPSACRTSAPAARTTPRPTCRKARARWPASAATTW